jgi:hypothetical protein
MEIQAITAGSLPVFRFSHITTLIVADIFLSIEDIFCPISRLEIGAEGADFPRLARCAWRVIEREGKFKADRG